MKYNTNGHGDQPVTGQLLHDTVWELWFHCGSQSSMGIGVMGRWGAGALGTVKNAILR